MATAFIGLGGNVGDVVSNMAGALKQFDALEGTKVVSVSKVYRTPPWGIEDQDWFHNACAKLETNLQPLELLKKCLRIERIFKRERDIRWGPRTLDLDILMYDDLSVDEENLTIPHPRMQERAFVMVPLADIAPEQIVQGKSVAQWVEALDIAELEEVGIGEEY